MNSQADGAAGPIERGAARVLGAEELFDLHAEFVAKFLWRMGVPAADIEDVVQDVFLVAHKKGGFREDGAKATTWLSAIAWRVWGTRRRSLRNRSEVADNHSVSSAPASTPGPADSLDATRGVARVRDALQALDQSARALLVLVDIDGEACQDVAGALGIPIGTVYSRLHAARKRFAAEYDKLLRPTALLRLR